MSQNNIKNWLLPLLAQKNLNVGDFATAVGLSRASVYLYLKGTVNPSTKNMTKICTFLGVPVEEGLKQYTPSKMGRPRKSEATTGEIAVTATAETVVAA